MKTLTLIIILFISCIILSSCGGERTRTYPNYTEKTVVIFNKMPKPVTLLSKDGKPGGHSVVLIDNNGKVYYMGSLSLFANSIGKSYTKGDTIK